MTEQFQPDAGDFQSDTSEALDRASSAISREFSPDARVQNGQGFATPKEISRARWVEQVVLIDQRAFTRDCISNSLRNLCGFEIAAFPSVQDSIERLADKTGICLVLFNLHETSITECHVERELTALRGGFPSVPLVLLSDVQSGEWVRDAVEVGAYGYICTSNATLDCAVELLSAARSGGACPVNGSRDAGRSVSAEVMSTTAVSEWTFTPREIAVLDRLWKGKPNKIIAYELAISEATAKIHVRNIMKKMGANNRTEVAFQLNRWAAASDRQLGVFERDKRRQDSRELSSE